MFTPFIINYFKMGIYNLADMWDFVSYGTFTKEEYKKITKSDYPDERPAEAQQDAWLQLFYEEEDGAMGPHYFFGLTWSELSAIVGIIVTLTSFFIWLTHAVITKPMELSNQSLQQAIDRLAKQVERQDNNAALVHKEHDRRLDGHDVRLAKHDEEIKTLFNRQQGRQQGRGDR